MRYIGIDIPDEDFVWLEERKWQDRTTVAEQVRTAIAEYRDRRTPSALPPAQPEDKHLAAFEAEQEAQRREFYKRPGTMTPGELAEQVTQ